MTLRLRMAAIVATAALTGTVLIVLSYLVVARMFETADRLIEEDLGRAQARASIHDALERIRRAQDRMGTSQGVSAQSEAQRVYAAVTAKQPAAAPPEDPPVECLRFQGLRVRPHSRDSVVAVCPNSGLAVLPKTTSPPRR